MQKIPYITLIIVFLLGACHSKEKEAEWKQREDILNAREQALLLKEKELQLFEDDLNRKVANLDSSVKALSDPILPLPDSLLGSWKVNMVCTETNCSGSAVGDIRKEVWDLNNADSSVTVKAFQGEKLIRVYTGLFNGHSIKLSTPQSDNAQPSTKMNVELQIMGKNKISGHRFITQADNCYITYKVDMEKSKNP